MQIVRYLREENAVFGVVSEVLTVGVDTLECEMGARPLEILAPRKCVADACVQRNNGRGEQECINADDGANSHFFETWPLWEG